MNGYECRFHDCEKPVNQLVANVGEAHQYLKIVLDALEKILIHLVVLNRTSCRCNIVLLIECNFLQALFQEREQGWSIHLLVGREIVDHLILKIWEHHCQKELWAKAGLARHNAGRVLVISSSKGDFDVVGLLQPIHDRAVKGVR